GSSAASSPARSADTKPPTLDAAVAGNQKRPVEDVSGPPKRANAAASDAGSRAVTPLTPPPTSSSSTPIAPPSTPTEALPPLTFDKLKLLVIEGDKTHEEDAALQFSDGLIVIHGAANQVVASMPYSAVRCLSSSRSRQPR